MDVVMEIVGRIWCISSLLDLHPVLKAPQSNKHADDCAITANQTTREKSLTALERITSALISINLFMINFTVLFYILLLY